jgi:hypothetical protein
MTNSVVPMAKALRVSASKAIGMRALLLECEGVSCGYLCGLSGSGAEHSCGRGKRYFEPLRYARVCP